MEADPGTGVRRGDGRAGTAELASALLSTVARALELERAALLLEESPGGPLVAVATHGGIEVPAIPPDWSGTDRDPYSASSDIPW